MEGKNLGGTIEGSAHGESSEKKRIMMKANCFSFEFHSFGSFLS